MSDMLVVVYFTMEVLLLELPRECFVLQTGTFVLKNCTQSHNSYKAIKFNTRNIVQSDLFDYFFLLNVLFVITECHTHTCTFAIEFDL